MSNLSRRDVLKSAAALPLLSTGSSFLRWLPDGDDRCLLVLELFGGNDGLNTVIPLNDAAWAAARPDLSAVRNGAHDVGGGFSLHPRMNGMAGLMRDGKMCVWHGVGMEGADRSHFRNIDIRHTADPAFRDLRADTTGWLGRAADILARRGAAVPGLSIGSQDVPLIFKARDVTVPSLARLEDCEVLVSPGGNAAGARRDELVELVHTESTGTDAADLRGFLTNVAETAVDQAEHMRQSLARYRAKADYPDTHLGRTLQLLSRLVVCGTGTRLFHVGFGGFDTHASQLDAHAALLGQLSGALTAFVRDLEGHGQLDRMLVLVQSEFGRRVAQNRSGGTDHGLAAPAFFLGSGLTPGLNGEHPSLTELEDGDLVPTADFRQTYAACLRWLGVDATAVLGEAFRGVEPFA